MKNNRMVVGFDKEGEALHLRTAKQKIKILNEALEVAKPFINEKIDVRKFIKGFSHYIFNEAIKNEDDDKRERINKETYCKMYSIPLEVLDALERQYKAIGSGLMLSENCEYFLIPDFNIYLDNEKQETVYKALEKFIKLFKYELKDCGINNSELMMTMRNLVIQKEGELIPGVNMIKRLR
jgi:hypothetical protein